jgi:hypothetical protein
MLGILKHCSIKAFVAAMSWCLISCGYEGFGYPNEELLIEYEVIEASVQQNQAIEPFPYILDVSMRRVSGGGRNHYYYCSEKEYTKEILGDTLVTVNGKPPSGINKGITGYTSGAIFSVYLDFLPQEGDVAIFNQKLFFAYSSSGTLDYWEKVGIITESMPIKIKTASLMQEIATIAD